VKTVVLFFNKGEPTRKVWYYQLDAGRNMGKTNPLNDKDMAEFVELQKTFADSEKSWSVKVSDVDTGSYDLSTKNPNTPEEAPLRDPAVIIEDIAAIDEQTASLLAEIKEML
jgi:type I restriction enzyme M protein